VDLQLVADGIMRAKALKRLDMVGCKLPAKQIGAVCYNLAFSSQLMVMNLAGTVIKNMGYVHEFEAAIAKLLSINHSLQYLFLNQIESFTTKLSTDAITTAISENVTLKTLDLSYSDCPDLHHGGVRSPCPGVEAALLTAKKTGNFRQAAWDRSNYFNLTMLMYFG
jgi:hypothetical protein